jgi:CBS domain-containing protein
MKVKEVMIREVKTCRAGDDLNRAAQIMWEFDCGTVPVVDEAGSVKGMITDRDVCMAAYTKGRRLESIQVRSAMSAEVATCSPDDTLEGALSIMKKARVRRLPVTDRGGRLVGILSMNDLAREAWREIESSDRHAITTDLAVALGTICEPTSPASAARKSASTLVGTGS